MKQVPIDYVLPVGGNTFNLIAFDILIDRPAPEWSRLVVAVVPVGVLGQFYCPLHIEFSMN